MSFFAPWMLLGLAAAAAPLLLHLLRRRTAERVAWGAWMFLSESLRLKKRKLLFEEILLLVLRTLVLGLVALAFARPFLPEMHLFGARGMDKDVVLVLDVSASMGLKGPDGRRAIDRALEEARKLVEKAPRGTSFGVVLGDAVPSILSPAPFTTKTEVLKLLDGEFALSVGAMDAPRTLAAAGEVLSAGNNPAKEVLVFGDAQGYGWRPDDTAEWGRVETIFRRFPIRPSVVWRVFETPPKVRNAALAAVAPSRRIIGTDRPVTFAVTVVNSGSEPFSPGDVSMAVNGLETRSSPVGQILPGLSRTFEFSHRFASNGVHDVVFSLSSEDDIAADNAVSNRVDVIGSLDVLLVNGRPGDAGFTGPAAFVAAALRPETKGTNRVFLVQPEIARAAALEDEKRFGGKAAVVLCDVPYLSGRALTNVTRYVTRGGGLLAIPGPRERCDLSTNAVFAAAWTNFDAKVENASFEGAPVVGRVRFSDAVYTNGAEVVSRFSDGEPALLLARRGAGRSAVFAAPLEMAWTTLPARPKFVPFVHELVYEIAGTNSVREAGDRNRWKAREGDLTPLSADELDAVRVAVELGFARTEDDALASVVGRSFGVEIWRPLALAALFLLVAELLLSRRIDRLREAKRPTRFQRALRILAFLAFAWMLLHVVWVHDHVRAIHRRVAVLTDRSLSMECRDGVGTNMPTRLEIATNLAAAVTRSLSGKFDVEPYAFGGETTDFAAALERVLEEIPSEELAGAVFVTDGRETAENPHEAVCRRFGRLGAKVTSVVVGGETNRRDVAIVRLRGAESVFLGDKVHVSATLCASGFKGRKVAARFLEGERELERREFEVDSDDWRQDLHFRDDPSEKGLRRYRVELETPDGDEEARNNRWPLDVSVSDDRTNVLLADRRPRWDFRYLKNLFYGRDKSVHLQYLLTEPDRLSGTLASELPPADATRPFGEAEASAFPAGRDAWRKFDVIILGDLPPGALDETQVADLKYCVEERGALLVFVAGPKHLPAGWARSPLAELLPVALTNAEGRVTAEWAASPVRLSLSPSGLAHPIMRIAENLSESERAWAQQPAWCGRVTGVTVKPGAETLAFAEGETVLSSPLLVAREVGRGKTLFLASDESWRLRYRKGDVWHHRFWGNVVKWGSGEKLRDGNAHARLGTDRLHYRPEESVRVLARLTGRDALPLEGVEPRAEIRLPDGKTRTIDLVKRPGSNGYYEGVFDGAEKLGDYVVTVASDKARAALGDDWPQPLQTKFFVDHGFKPVEWAVLTADRATAADMARLTGGALFSPERADEIKPELFGAGRSEVIEHTETHLWDHPAGFVVLAVALILLWYLRKRRGLS